MLFTFSYLMFTASKWAKGKEAQTGTDLLLWLTNNQKRNFSRRRPTDINLLSKEDFQAVNKDMSPLAGENCSWQEQEQAYTFTRCPPGFPGFGLSQPQPFCEDMKIVAERRVDFSNQLRKGTSICPPVSSLF